MNKILKILSILVIGFVMFSCSTPTNDPETPAPNPEVQTYSITFTTKNYNIQFVVDYLNSLPEFKNLEEDDEVSLREFFYLNEELNNITKEENENSVNKLYIYYDNEDPGIDSVVIGNKDVELEIFLKEVVRYR